MSETSDYARQRVGELAAENARLKARCAELEKQKRQLEEACDLATCYVEGEAEERVIDLFHKLKGEAK